MRKMIRFLSLTISIPLVLCATQALAADGAALYKANCASCHGADGKAETPVAKAMKVPALAGKSLTAEQVVSQVRTNDKHKAVSTKLSDEDLAAIAGALPK